MNNKFSEALTKLDAQTKTELMAAIMDDSEVKEANGANPEGEKGKSTQAQVLIKLAGVAALFHTPHKEPYATIPVNDHFENWPIKSTGFRMWLLQRFYRENGKPPSTQALQDALALLEAQAQFDSPECPIHTRVAELDGNIYLDLCNESWQAVEISPKGWRILDKSPVKFYRAKGMLPIPQPLKPAGSIEELKRFVNIGNESDWKLLVAWLVAAMRPSGPYPVLTLQGEQGTAKSTTSKVLRSLIDPSTAPLRNTPREERDLAIAAHNSWALCFDNLSGMSLWLSDALCRVATGGGFSTRTLYANDEETIFDYIRPVIVNGIDEIVARHDLLDRSIVITLPVIHDEARQDERAFWAAFEEARPRILGGLLNAASTALKNASVVKLDKLPRMADFAKWVAAAEPALPWEPGGFLEAYGGNRSEAMELALESSVIATAIREFLEEINEWEGSATDLHKVLQDIIPEETKKTKSWPKTAPSLAKKLREMATFLRRTGIEVVFFRQPGGDRRKVIKIYRNSTVPAVPSVPESQKSPSYPGVKGGTQGRHDRDGKIAGSISSSPHRPGENQGTTNLWNHRDDRDGRKPPYFKEPDPWLEIGSEVKGP